MGLPAANMLEATQKCICRWGPNKNQTYDCVNPCGSDLDSPLYYDFEEPFNYVSSPTGEIVSFEGSNRWITQKVYGPLNFGEILTNYTARIDGFSFWFWDPGNSAVGTSLGGSMSYIGAGNKGYAIYKSSSGSAQYLIYSDGNSVATGNGRYNTQRWNHFFVQVQHGAAGRLTGEKKISAWLNGRLAINNFTYTRNVLYDCPNEALNFAFADGAGSGSGFAYRIYRDDLRIYQGNTPVLPMQQEFEYPYEIEKRIDGLTRASEFTEQFCDCRLSDKYYPSGNYNIAINFSGKNVVRKQCFEGDCTIDCNTNPLFQCQIVTASKNINNWPGGGILRKINNEEIDECGVSRLSPLYSLYSCPSMDDDPSAGDCGFPLATIQSVGCSASWVDPVMDIEVTTGTLLLDGKSAAAAYSLRRLNTAYTGPVIRVRRDLDNAELDFSADDIINGKLRSFTVGTGSFPRRSYVTIWYDQSGNGKNAVQANTSLQPEIMRIMTGTGNQEPNKFGLRYQETVPQDYQFHFPGVYFNNDYLVSQLAWANTKYTTFTVFGSDTSGYSVLWGLAPAGSLNDYYLVHYNGSLYIGGGDTFSRLTSGYPEPGYDYQDPFITCTTWDNTTGNYGAGVNGLPFQTFNTAMRTGSPGNYFGVGATGTGSQPIENGFMMELIIFDSDQTSARSEIETNQNNYYRISRNISDY